MSTPTPATEPKVPTEGSIDEKGSTSVEEQLVGELSSEIDLLAYHEHNAGRLVIDPEYVLSTPLVRRYLD